MSDHHGARSFEPQYRFGVFDFDSRSLELRKTGRLIAIRPQPAKVLALLLAQPHTLVTRDDLQRALWDDGTFVDFEQGVNHAVRELRAALGDLAESPRFIETLPRRGYRFIAPVTAPAGPSPERDVAQAPSPGVPVESAVPSRSRWPGAWWLAAAALVAALAGAGLAWSTAASDPPPPADRLQVHAFTGTAGDRASGRGLAQAIAARLGAQRSLTVRAGGRDDGAPLVLDGDIAAAGDDLTVTPRLYDTRSGRTLWTEHIRLRADQFYDAEAVIAERVVAALRLQLAATEQDRLRRRYTSNAAAYAAYLSGRDALVQYTPAGTTAAVAAFEAALRVDADYALARAGLAMACADQYLRFAPPAEVERWAERAETEARAALALDADLAEAHLARAMVARKREFDWAGALDASRRALVLNPSLAQAHLIMAAAYYHLGYMEEAAIALENGRRLRGDDVIEPERIDGLVALFSGRFAPALAHLEEVSRLSSEPIGDTYLALAHYYSGRVDRGQAMLEQLAEHRSASTAARAGAALAAVLAAAGDRGGAMDRLRRVQAGNYRDHHVAYGLGVAYAQLGATADAVHWLRVAADTGFPCRPWFEADPLLAPLRTAPDYAVLLEHVDARRKTGARTGS